MLIELLILIVVTVECILSITFFFIKKKRPDINCDNCLRPLPLKKTLDGKYWLCRTCRKVYNKEIS